MSSLTTANEAIFIQLKRAYKEMSWYERFFFPWALAAELNKINDSNPSIENAFHVYNAFVNHTWFFQRWFFSSLEVFADSDLVQALSQLQSTGLLEGDEAQANFNVVAGHEYVFTVPEVLITLQNAGLLTGNAAQDNRDAVAGHQGLLRFVNNALCVLQKAGLLTGSAAQTNFNAVIKCKNSRLFNQAICTLYNGDLIHGSDGQTNFDGVAGAQFPAVFADALSTLHKAGLLTSNDGQANRDALAGHKDPKWVAKALSSLQKTDLLRGSDAQANRDAVARHENAERVADALHFLQQAGLLTGSDAQANFNNVVITYSSILCGYFPNTHPSVCIVWYRLRPSELTATRFQTIMDLCEQNTSYLRAGLEAVNDYVQNIIENREKAQAIVFKVNTKTHTENSRQSVSDRFNQTSTLQNNKVTFFSLDPAPSSSSESNNFPSEQKFPQ